MLLSQVNLHGHIKVPSDARFTCLWCTRTKIHLLQVCPVHGVDPVNLLVRGMFSLLNIVLCVGPKSEYSFTVLCALVIVYYTQVDGMRSWDIPYVFGHYELLVLKIIILIQFSSITWSVGRSCVLHTQNPSCFDDWWLIPHRRTFREGWWSVLACSLVAVESDSWCSVPTALLTGEGLGWDL